MMSLDTMAVDRAHGEDVFDLDVRAIPERGAMPSMGYTYGCGGDDEIGLSILCSIICSD